MSINREDFSHLDKTPQIGKGVFIASSANLIGDVVLGNDVSVWYHVVIRGDINQIAIGEGSNIQDGTVIHVADQYSVKLGKNVVVGHQATIHACTIGDRCLIGMKSTIMDGAEIGEGCIIGAGAVVSPRMKVPPRSIVLGLPGKIKREVTEEEYHNILHLANKYIRLKNLYLEKGYK
jgi:carbonic anhydrase/acetyltransferase-like protein (isoleucine patch superfamily)